jgi:hypothetical protein
MFVLLRKEDRHHLFLHPLTLLHQPQIGYHPQKTQATHQQIPDPSLPFHVREDNSNKNYHIDLSQRELSLTLLHIAHNHVEVFQEEVNHLESV